ncbi:hypothetical protein CEXT_350181 [Caerostris extrusa]|uniref:Uncharacterized protein n=1 Tax=Caerostris extrusa TaxID=172846 RepID=A0AAV4X2Y1_CAEEX|nr:hypothetical protein CEXT_350181 [Caerostris extrusa]
MKLKAFRIACIVNGQDLWGALLSCRRRTDDKLVSSGASLCILIGRSLTMVFNLFPRVIHPSGRNKLFLQTMAIPIQRRMLNHLSS